MESPLPAPGQFAWEGRLPVLALAGRDRLEGGPGPEVVVRINTAHGCELPEVSPNDPLPEVGQVLEFEVAGVPAQFYRYVVVPRGLRAFYTDRISLTTFGLYLERGGHRYLFLLEGDQPELAQDEALFLKQNHRILQAAYEIKALEDLRKHPFLEAVEGFFASRKVLRREERLYVAEVAAELRGDVTFLHRRDDPADHRLRVALRASPGEEVGLAVRLGSQVRKLYKDRLVEERGRGVKGKRAELRLPVPGGFEVRKGKTDKEGWVSFDALELTGPRALRVGIGDLEVRFDLRWGRPGELALDMASPQLGALSTSLPLAKAGERLRADLRACWDPDTGRIREMTPGQALDFDREAVEAGLALRDEGDEIWAEFLQEATRILKARRKGRGGDPIDPVVAHLLGVTSARVAVPELRAQFEHHERKPPGLWTEEYALLVQGLASLVRSRPGKAIEKLARRAAESFASRVEVEPEPTWEYRALRRPVKTFRANPDVALPHAQGILAMLRAAEVLEGLDWIREVATVQGHHLVEHHPVDGEPPPYVMGTWKDRARLETPARLGLALDALARHGGDQDILGREERLRRLVWQRFLLDYHSAETRDRVLLLRWLGEVEWVLPPRRSGNGRSPGSR